MRRYGRILRLGPDFCAHHICPGEHLQRSVPRHYCVSGVLGDRAEETGGAADRSGIRLIRLISRIGRIGRVALGNENHIITRLQTAQSNHAPWLFQAIDFPACIY